MNSYRDHVTLSVSQWIPTDGPHADSHFGSLDSPDCRLGERLSAAPLCGRLIQTPDQLLESWRVHLIRLWSSDSRDHYEPADIFHKMYYINV